MKEKLTPKQDLFCKEYIVDLNATQAAIRAGYSKNTAQEIGAQNLSKLIIQNRVKFLKDKRSEKVEITAEMVLREYAKIGFSNIQDYIKSGYSLSEINQIDKDAAGAISSIQVTTRTNDFGTETDIKFKLHSKIAALDSISKHIGFFEKDNNQKQTSPQEWIIGGKKIQF